MKDITQIDPRFLTSVQLDRNSVTAYDVTLPPFSVHGLLLPQDENDRFRRLPEEVAAATNPGVLELHANTAGGRVRFVTDASVIGICAVMPRRCRASHFALSGSCGFDLYAAKTDGSGVHHVQTFLPPYDMTDTYTGVYRCAGGEMTEYTLNFPLYSDVSSLYVLLSKGATVGAPRSYRVQTPVVYYGSSITQGGCASRPGNAYQSMIARRLDCDFVNLGFSGSACGETVIADYIAGLSMSAFVMDYDHNAPDVAHLAATHAPMFARIRAENPTLPIICVSRPDYFFCPAECEPRRQVIEKTVRDAVVAGDRYVSFVDGRDFAAQFGAGDCISVDGCHPNDLGFFCMAIRLGTELAHWIGQNELTE